MRHEIGGSLAEEDAAIILGNARKVRRLRNDLESLQEHLPFRVRVRSAKGKLKYIREKKGEVF